SFDLIIAIDPDWVALKKEQSKLLRKGIEERGCGMVFVAGPTHTRQLAGRDAELASIKAVLPVVPKDGREHFGKEKHDASRPYALKFTKAAKKFAFLKLAGDNPLGGWDSFFWKDGEEPDGYSIPERGFHTYYPVEKLRPGATVLASFVGPDGSRI